MIYFGNFEYHTPLRYKFDSANLKLPLIVPLFAGQAVFISFYSKNNSRFAIISPYSV